MRKQTKRHKSKNQNIKFHNLHIINILKKTPCKWTITYFYKNIKSFNQLDTPELRQQILQSLEQIKLSIVAIAPVPGGGFMGLPLDKWSDERFYTIPKKDDFFCQFFSFFPVKDFRKATISSVSSLLSFLPNW